MDAGGDIKNAYSSALEELAATLAAETAAALG
jgi:hypothetical protein